MNWLISRLVRYCNMSIKSNQPTASSDITQPLVCVIGLACLISLKERSRERRWQSSTKSVYRHNKSISMYNQTVNTHKSIYPITYKPGILQKCPPPCLWLSFAAALHKTKAPLFPCTAALCPKQLVRGRETKSCLCSAEQGPVLVLYVAEWALYCVAEPSLHAIQTDGAVPLCLNA